MVAGSTSLKVKKQQINAAAASLRGATETSPRGREACRWPPAPRWRRSAWPSAGCGSSALCCRRPWCSWGRWWLCSGSSAADGGAGTPAGSCSGARCCGAEPRWSADSVPGSGRRAAEPRSGWSAGPSRSSRTRWICEEWSVEEWWGSRDGRHRGSSKGRHTLSWAPPVGWVATGD